MNFSHQTWKKFVFICAANSVIIAAVFCTFGCSGGLAGTKSGGSNPKLDVSNEKAYNASMLQILEAMTKRDPVKAKKLLDIWGVFLVAIIPNSRNITYNDPEIQEQFDAMKARIVDLLGSMHGKDGDAILAVCTKTFESDAEGKFTLREVTDKWKEIDPAKADLYKTDMLREIDNIKMGLLKNELDTENVPVAKNTTLDTSSVGAVDRSFFLMVRLARETGDPASLLAASKLVDIHAAATSLIYPDGKFRISQVSLSSSEWQNDENRAKIDDFLRRMNGKNAEAILAEASKPGSVFAVILAPYGQMDPKQEEVQVLFSRSAEKWETEVTTARRPLREEF